MPTFRNPTTQPGRFYLWCFNGPPKSLRGWHASGDRAGIRNAIDISLEVQAGLTPYRTLRLTAPSTAVLSVPGCSLRGGFASPCRLRIRRVSEARDSSLELADQGTVVLFSANQEAFSDWQTALNYLLEDEGDFRLPFGTEYVWFWWHLGR